MDLLLICRDALSSSLLSTTLTATEAKKAGVDVGVLFTEEALAAVCGGTFAWPTGLTGQELRYRMADNAKAMGIPTMGGKGDARQIDIRQLVGMAKEGGIPMFACPVWAGLLGLQGKLPQGIAEVDAPTLLKMIAETKTIIGSF